MSIFTKCEVPSVEYRGQTVENLPVNLNIVHQIGKGTLRWYPDNDGIPSIYFIINGETIRWAFKTAEDRDKQFTALLD